MFYASKFIIITPRPLVASLPRCLVTLLQPCFVACLHFFVEELPRGIVAFRVHGYYFRDHPRHIGHCCFSCAPAPSATALTNKFALARSKNIALVQSVCACTLSLHSPAQFALARSKIKLLLRAPKQITLALSVCACTLQI